MSETLTPDLCVIGAGSGGLTVAAAACAMGASVVLVEKGKMGGDCLNYGCVPSKALLAAAKAAHTFRASAKFGIKNTEPAIDFSLVNAHVRGVIDTIAPHDSVERFEGLGATVIQAGAKFLDARTIEAGGKKIRPRRVVIATGSRAVVPPIPGLDKTPYLTNENIFDLTEKPDHLVIVGGGPIGMEMAQAHRRLGCKVTVLDMAPPLGKDDPELTAIALRKIEAEGVVILAPAKVLSIAGSAGKGITVTIETGGENKDIAGSHLLMAVGRAPQTADLGLEVAGIKTHRGAIVISSALKTSNRRVYAIGDVTGGLMFTHVAGYQAGLVVRNALFGLPVRYDTAAIPWTTYTDPEIGQVGLTEAAAREKLGDRFKVLRWKYTENDRATAERRTDGLLKVITDPKGRILGAGAVGMLAGELISFYAFAIANRMKVGAFVKFVAPYPTLTEVAKRVAVEFYRDALDNPWLGRLRAFNRLLP
ncbi:MAG: FAD-dependent oxidoreductase [Alphaproteobacteria bacterium]|nr:FAD-dependent oxidoreductase [Alphaproteobacteria bacterium]